MDSSTKAGEGSSDLSTGGDAAGNDDTSALFYRENGFVVFTAAYHLSRGSCCGSGCRHCPYEPAHQAGGTVVSKAFAADQPARQSA